jgi:hypothetical protein
MPDEDVPISETDLAQMFEEEGKAVDPEPEFQPEQTDIEPELVVEPEVPLPDPDGGEPPSTEELTGEPETAEHLAWAERRNLTDFEAAAKLAYEQERFLGRRANELTEARERADALEEALSAQAPQTPARSDDWIQQAVMSPDPGRYAFELARVGDWQTYERMMETWEGVVGETITVGVHNQIMAAMQAAAEAEGPQPNGDVQGAIREAFAANGVYDMLGDPLMATVKKVADELGGQSEIVLGVARGDAIATQALVEIARARSLTTRTLRISENDERPDVTAEGQSPSRTPQKPDPFADMTEEWRRMGVLPVEE